MAESERVTASEYARRVGKAIGTVQKAVATGRVVRGPDGLIAVADADRYWQNCKAATVANRELAAARLRRLQAQASLLELRADAAEGKLVSVAEVKAFIFASSRVVRDLLLAIPAQLAPMLVGKSEHEVRQLVGTAIRQALADLPDELPATMLASGQRVARRL